MKDVRELFITELRDMYNAELQLVRALPQMAKAAANEKLRELFELHLGETKIQVERLEKIAEELNIDLKGKECAGMRALIQEGEEMMKAGFSADVKDAAIIGCAQKVEHYEIAAYGTIKAFAKQLGLKSVEKLIGDSLKEEGKADEKLTDLALGGLFTTGINEKAAHKRSA